MNREERNYRVAFYSLVGLVIVTLLLSLLSCSDEKTEPECIYCDVILWGFIKDREYQELTRDSIPCTEPFTLQQAIDNVAYGKDVEEVKCYYK